jgi:hypothetical protein
MYGLPMRLCLKSFAESILKYLVMVFTVASMIIALSLSLIAIGLLAGFSQ